MRFRQVHLDFHTSERIPGIGSRFSKAQFQDMLRVGHVDSITVFSKCHHGWAYHPSEANEIHPELDFDLLGAQIEAAHEIGVKTPVYLSAGLDEKLARTHPEWLLRRPDESTTWAADFLSPGYHRFCMNTPYLDILCAQIEEVVSRYDADGIFLDIVGVADCYCHACIASIRDAGGDPRDPAAVRALAERTYATYAARTNESVHRIKPGLPVFHNGGHIRRGRRDLAGFNTHLELESLPTGGWGYDHFPLSARYVQTLGMDFLGMTGKFHTSWGEFGGYKHPNALRYETALSLANGARISVGDQLHPEGRMDEATYALIGAAFAEVEAKEPWCVGVEAVADVALLSVEAYSGGSPDSRGEPTGDPDAGAVRMLLEGKLLFDVIDLEADFGKYKVLILPDRYAIDERLGAKLRDFLSGGGRVLATGSSGLRADGEDFALNLGARSVGKAPYRPDYFRPDFPIAGLPSASYVMYSEGREIAAVEGGVVLGEREHPYFNRDAFSFCSHQHTPGSQLPSGPAMTEGADGIYIAWQVFSEYAEMGSLVLRETVLYALNRLLPDKTLETNLPAQGIVTVQKQPAERRWVNHLLYASPVRRGNGIEVIEDLVPIRDVTVSLRVPSAVSSVTLEPGGRPLAYDQADGTVRYTVPEVLCHQMVVLAFA
ncbi:beta-galactosidase trimerization domain-containing protein [Cohnella sp. REN36]|uniref:beta-galactosidase trimerization domain-containing protein n=1 Tax=Cohnella sp. REN36 TaxID=2887347 RepID=UPI001D15DB5E|nr:beta-galactosidase trimerization domain-containing protein [Cohnella sp. REN36]MCC3371628.1 beta-galactosidase trimerization domain-containing protein [Cohnella sp. REN36]